MNVFLALAVLSLDIVSPKADEAVSLQTGGQRRYLSLPEGERRMQIADRAARTNLNLIGWKPAVVRVEWLGPDGARYALELSRDGRTVFVTNGLSLCHCDLHNLEIARRYRVTVRAKKDDDVASASRDFTTADQAPRLIDFGPVPNARDLGGRIGLGGRRVRQGRIYRSAGLNENANDYCSGTETYALWQAGRLGESAEGREYLVWINEHKSMKPEDFKTMKKTMVVKTWRKGAERLDEPTRRYLRDTLGIRTDIDLRTDRECWGMTGSPLGPAIRWHHVSSSQYGGLTNQAGRAAFAKIFPVFLDERNYPIDFHCIAGADRTGSLAYALNALLGVSDDELQKDWEVTAWWSPTMAKKGHGTTYDKLAAAFAALPGANTLERVEGYVKSCGFTDDDIAAFRRLMLEEKEEE